MYSRKKEFSATDNADRHSFNRNALDTELQTNVLTLDQSAHHIAPISGQLKDLTRLIQGMTNKQLNLPPTATTGDQFLSVAIPDEIFR